MSGTNYTVSSKFQLIDLNEDSANFNIAFEILCKDRVRCQI